jgi:hypothetical protein
MKPFFIKIPNYVFSLDIQFGQIHFMGIWGILGRFISADFGIESSLSMFSINQSLFLQKTKPLYPNPKYLFGIGISICAAKN